MPLETATYISSLVVTNPDGADQKNTADDHIRLLKACLRRSLPLIDGAVSLSHTQLMRLNDVSASIQLQINTLRDGSATVYNALYANSASFAANANNALSLGGSPAANYLRKDQVGTLVATPLIIQPGVTGDMIRLAGPNDLLFSWWNLAMTTRNAYVQMETSASPFRFIIFNELGGPVDLHCSQIRWNGTNAVWHSGNDGAGSGMDADLLDGHEASSAATGSTAALRNASGHLFAVYFNTSGPVNENPNVASVCVTSGDGYIRQSTPASLGSQMSARNISNKTGTNKTLSSSSPSGGQDGDIWYQL
jgi:hypothetical protein